MSFRGRGGGFNRGTGSFRGGRNAGGFNRGRGGGFDKGSRGYDQGPPEEITLLGHFTWPIEEGLVVKVDIEKVPFFNAPIYTENKKHIGKIDEIFGSIRDYYVSIKLPKDIKPSSFIKDTQLYIDPAKLLPLQRFLPKAPGEQKRGSSAGRVMKRGAGGRGGSGRGNSRGSYGRGSGGGFGNRGTGGFRGRGFNRNNTGGSRGGGRGRW